MLCEENKLIKAQPKIKFINQDKSPGLKKGGFLHIVARKLDVLCNNEKSIPDFIEADVQPLHVGSKFRANNLTLPEGVKLLKKGNFLIASIIGRGKSDDDKSATATATATPTATTPAKEPAKAGDKKPEAKK